MPESSLERVVAERDFLAPLQQRGAALFLLGNSLLSKGPPRWQKRDYFLLHSEADELESFLDDYGARYNKTFHYLTELVASVRGFSLAAMSVEHLIRRLDGYRVVESFTREEGSHAVRGLREARGFVQDVLERLLTAMRSESLGLGLSWPEPGPPPEGDESPFQRSSLPRNVGQEAIDDEEQRIAEVSSKYLQACTMLEECGVRRIEDPRGIEAYLARHCTEELARVYEATVHNLQSTYDTHIGNTVIEGRDERLPRLRGHVSSTLHVLEAVTQLTHFVERHESGQRSDAAEVKLAGIVRREEVQDVTLNKLLFWAHRFLLQGKALAEELLPTYMDVQALEVTIVDGLTLHARPVSLIVGIVNHYGTPVEMEVAGQTCSAGSILELMIAVGSNSECRTFVFRGDAAPLRDIGLLFEHSLGEEGLDALPPELAYLRRA